MMINQKLLFYQKLANSFHMFNFLTNKLLFQKKFQKRFLKMKRMIIKLNQMRNKIKK